MAKKQKEVDLGGYAPKVEDIESSIRVMGRLARMDKEAYERSGTAEDRRVMERTLLKHADLVKMRWQMEKTRMEVSAMGRGSVLTDQARVRIRVVKPNKEVNDE